MPPIQAGDELCTACMTYHPPPDCDHNAALPCFFCKGRRGYRWTDSNGRAGGRPLKCWRCEWGIPERPPMNSEAP